MYAQVDFGQKKLRTCNGTHSMKHYLLKRKYAHIENIKRQSLINNVYNSYMTLMILSNSSFIPSQEKVSCEMKLYPSNS